jgi:hypothetical protein
VSGNAGIVRQLVHITPSSSHDPAHEKRGILVLEELCMKSSDMMPIPLSSRPNTELTKIGEKPSGEGYKTITYQGADGNRYEVMVKDDTEARWMLIPTSPDPKE